MSGQLGQLPAEPTQRAPNTFIHDDVLVDANAPKDGLELDSERAVVEGRGVVDTVDESEALVDCARPSLPGRSPPLHLSPLPISASCQPAELGIERDEIRVSLVF